MEHDVEQSVLAQLEAWVQAPVGMSERDALAHVRGCAHVAFERLRWPADVPADRAARTFFRDVRFCFPLTRQRAVWELAVRGCRYVERASAGDLTLRRACPVQTRTGTPCRRPPLPNGWCPSHQHLAEERFAALAG